jgi:uncharacterized membrane protein
VRVGEVSQLAVGTVFAVGGIFWLVRTARRLRRKENASRAVWLLVVERGASWLVVGLALAFSALGSPSTGHWLFLGACGLFVVESVVWHALLPKLAADFDEVFR